jgi:uncharacterized protein YdeI (YjbR/CyaY-like superfamily)
MRGLELDEEHRVLHEPNDFARGLDSSPAARTACDRLAYTHKREHIRSIEGAKRAETRGRRITTALQTLRRIIE